MAIDQSQPETGSDAIPKKRYHPPKIVCFGSIQSLPDVGLGAFDADRVHHAEVAIAGDHCADPDERDLSWLAHSV